MFLSVARRLIGLSFLAAGALALAAPAAGAATVTVTPTGQLSDGQTVTVSVADVTPGSTLLAVECSPAALSISEDACENHRNAAFFADASGNATTALTVTSQISTAAGTDSCTTAVCLVGVVRFTAPTSDEIVGVAALSFGSKACHGGTRCEDAPPVPSTLSPASRRIAPVRGAVLVTPSKPFTTKLTATTAANLRSPSAITGPYTAGAGAAAAAASTGRGEGLLQLSMDGPGTSWASNTDKAAVADVRVDRGAWQQIVLFAGSSPFTYAGFTGPLGAGTHRVSVRVDTTLSTTGHHLPAVALYQAQLRVVAPHNPMYLLQKYAPVIFGRTTSAGSDTQLLTDGSATSAGGGATALSYTTIWTHEDAGTSFVPFLEWGEWGRMTDITGTATLDVSATGAISHAMYNWCGCQPPFPPSRDSLQEVSVPFSGRYFDGTHMILRNASGNDYQSQVGTTAFRFQQPAVPGPPAGQPREAVMDAHPWTYQIMDDEIRSWYLDRSTAPASAQPGDTGQYAIASLNTTAPQGTTVAVELRLSGSATWYQSDMGSGAPLYTGGLGRTVVKLPEGWERRKIAGVRLAVYPGTAASSVKVQSFQVLGVTPTFQVARISTPQPDIVPGAIR
jgi:Neocarzinostatin family